MSRRHRHVWVYLRFPCLSEPRMTYWSWVCSDCDATGHEVPR